MIKRIGMIVLMGALVLTGCVFPSIDEEEEIIEEVEQQEEVMVSPDIKTSENYYRNVLQEGKYRHSEARGYINAVVFNRLDIDHLEVGLMEIASERFNHEDYFFQEGQYLTSAEINKWLIRYHETNNTEGINPPLGAGDSLRQKEESSPRYLSHILEQNYLIQNEQGSFELGGVAIALSLNQVYYFRTRDDQGLYSPWYEVEISPETMEREGKRMAEEVLQRLREKGELAEVPITIGLYKEETRNSLVPGTYFAVATAEPGKGFDRWQRINEKYYFFPSREATEANRPDATNFLNFKEDIDRFFSNYIGIIGQGLYRNEQLQELKIEIPMQFYGKAEIIAFTQFVTDRIEQRFPDHIPIQVYISSIQGPESIIVREPNEEPFVHIYR
ncbi:CamS family sex pheromone protein [Anaerobacillus sp. MEB173]|uniref:CamS family sex pheromone protein n=1 Tax=Anaerobacillus sp. MEB173 TaxID=3383345 RepID=UPI003F90CE07